MCVCVSVGEREKERERDEFKEGEMGVLLCAMCSSWELERERMCAALGSWERKRFRVRFGFSIWYYFSKLKGKAIMGSWTWPTGLIT